MNVPAAPLIIPDTNAWSTLADDPARWPEGVDVSFGQWQKLALARGFMREQPLLRDFLYVADSKLCTRTAMDHIDTAGGRFVTVLPRTRREDGWFRDWLTHNAPPWTQTLTVPARRRAAGKRASNRTSRRSRLGIRSAEPHATTRGSGGCGRA